MPYKFKITVEKIDDQGITSADARLQFEVDNHDDILGIAERVRAKNWLKESDANSLAVGVKLFTEVLLKNRSEPLFKELQPAITKFMAGLKSR